MKYNIENNNFEISLIKQNIKNKFIIQTKEITLSINSKHLTINECVDSCESGSTLLEEGDRKCLRECNSEGKKYKYQSTCVEKCPEGFYIEGNDCKSRCDTQQYYKKNTDDNNYQCIQVLVREQEFVQIIHQCPLLSLKQMFSKVQEVFPHKVH